MRTLKVLAVLALLLLPCVGTAQKAKTAKREAADRKSRPYLYVTPKGLDALRDKLKTEPFAARWVRALGVANDMVARPVSSENVIGGNRARPALGLLSLCSFAYAITNDRKYADRAKAEAWSILGQSTWNENRGWNQGAQLETAECSQGCALFYDWCRGILSDEERQWFAEKALELGLKPYLASIEQFRPRNVDLWVDNPVTNWCGVCHGGCGLLGLALYDELPEARKAADYAWSHLNTFLDKVILADGGGYEGVMYWRYGVGMALDFTLAWEHCMAEEMPLKTFERLAGYWDIYMYGPDRRYANFNNMGEDTFRDLFGADSRTFEGGPSQALNAIFEARTPGGDPLLLWGADWGGGPWTTNGYAWQWFVFRRATPQAPQQMPELQREVLFRESGHTLYRYDKLWVAFNGGWTSDKSHSNMDLGTFVLVYDGERLVHDPGYGHTRADQHSTIVIDGQDQRKPAQAKYTAWRGGKGYHWLQCDVTDAWGDRAKKCVRTMVVVDGKYVVLLDEVETSGSTNVEARVQSRRTIMVKDNAATIEGERNTLHVIAASPKATLATGRHEINFVGIKAAQPKAEQVFVTVLYPDKRGAAAPSVDWAEKGGTGTLKVGGDKLEFKQTSAGWVLGKVGNEKVEKPEAPKDRVLKPVK